MSKSTNPQTQTDQSQSVELLEIKATLNEFISNYPPEFKNKLANRVRKLRNYLQSVLIHTPSDITSAVKKIENISAKLEEFFTSLIGDYGRDVLSSLEEEDVTILLKLIQKYWTTHFYAQLFGLIEIATKSTQLDNIIAKYGSQITPEHLNLNLKLNIPEVCSCFYLAIGELVLFSCTKCAHEKLDCIYKSCRFIMEGLSMSMNGQPVSADDFLPALIYTIMKAKVPSLLCHITFVSKFIGIEGSLDFGEPAYYFTNLVGACEMIETGLDALTSGAVRPDKFNQDKYCFGESIEIIHKERRVVFESRTEELVQLLKGKKAILDSALRDEKERKVWNVIKWIPAINIAYGTLASVVYAVKGNKCEVSNRMIGTVGGVAGIAAGIGGALVSGPLIVPILASMVAGGASNQVVTGGGEMAVESIRNPDWFKSLTPDQREIQIYDRVIKDIPLLGFGYSLVRAPTYLIKGNKREAKKSGINGLINAGASGIGVAAGVGLAKLTAGLPARAASATAVEAGEDVVKPMATEIIDFVTNQAIRVVTSESGQATIRTGVCNLSRIVADEVIYGDGAEFFDVF